VEAGRAKLVRIAWREEARMDVRNDMMVMMRVDRKGKVTSEIQVCRLKERKSI
jgi:hypothetical protein